jgi:hypothetical protein
MHPISLSDIFTGANFIVALAFYRKLSIALFQHKLMWLDYAARKGISPKEPSAASGD